MTSLIYHRLAPMASMMMNLRVAVTSHCYINVIKDPSGALFGVSSNLAAPGQVDV